MSTPVKDSPAPPTTLEKRGSFNKYFSKVKTALKRSDSSAKRQSIQGKSSAPSKPSTTEPSSSKIPEQKETEEAIITSEESKDASTKKKLMRSDIQAERTQKLGERFQIRLEPLTIVDDKEVFRVEKAIRMRVHRSCHKCDTPFGPNKICSNCQHTRCKSCPRFPAKGSGAKGKGKEAFAGNYLEPDTYWNLKEEYVLTMPPRRPGGQPLVRKHPKQRIRRNCHECSTLFLSKSKECAQCGHIRCTECPRDPAKKNKYPDGYPGDAFSNDISKPIKYACSDCNKTFPPVPHPDSEEGKALAANPDAEKQKCARCGHERCSKCKRALPRRVEPVVDADVLKSLEAKLVSLRVSS